jgi:tetraacyldisaccharide-1-P 4'-kinase
MHALATDNTNLSRFVMQKWQQKTFSEVASETAQNTMRAIAHHQAKQIGFKPTDDNHLAAAIGNPDSFLETLRTSYFYFMEYGPFTDDEFSSFQLDVSYAVMAAHNIIYDLSTSYDAVSRLENADTLTLYGDAYSSMPKEFDCETMAGDLIQFEG